MPGYRNILYCTDYSEDAGVAFVYAADLAARYHAALHVLHVLQSRHRYSPNQIYEGQPAGELAEATPQVLEKAAERLRHEFGPRVNELKDVCYQTRVGTPFVEILRYARDHAVDLIVLGAKGSSELEPTHYGSTVDQVSRRANCHVMAIRNPEKTYTL
ncbi:MAG: universal stress protein [Deltaproteobacteria bacterium]|nr:universal stress protein [Deltaproteobacteria bacterium]